MNTDDIIKDYLSLRSEPYIIKKYKISIAELTKLLIKAKLILPAIHDENTKNLIVEDYKNSLSCYATAIKFKTTAFHVRKYVKQKSIKITNKMREDKYGKTFINCVLAIYKNCAKKRNLNFEITYEDFARLIEKNCYYCNAGLLNRMTRNNGTSVNFYNGIDRVDNNKHYTISNVVTCCYRCNEAKRHYTLLDFRDHIIKLKKHLNL